MCRAVDPTDISTRLGRGVTEPTSPSILARQTESSNAFGEATRTAGERRFGVGGASSVRVDEPNWLERVRSLRPGGADDDDAEDEEGDEDDEGDLDEWEDDDWGDEEEEMVAAARIRWGTDLMNVSISRL
jgi:hypothetical protein